MKNFFSYRTETLLWVTTGLLLLLPISVPAATPLSQCKKLKGKDLIYGIGSSMMGSDLGPMLKTRLSARGHKFRKWGQASSGLARPDFHDWPKQAKKVAKRQRPKVFIVALGSNDYQDLKHGKRWVKFGSKKWEKLYAERIDKMLTAMTGPKKQRAVIWMGPIAFKGKRAERRGPIVNDLMRKRVKAFDGPVFFVDGYKKTLTAKGRPLRTFKHPKSGKSIRARSKDNIHLSTQAVHWLVANPILKILDRCLPPKKSPPKP